MIKNCPNCGSTLEEGKRKSYETLVEHTTNPNKWLNESPPKRETLVCENRDCLMSWIDVFWSPDGEFFSGKSVISMGLHRDGTFDGMDRFSKN